MPVRLAEFVRDEIAERGWPVFEVSTVARDGLRPLIFALWDMVADYRAAQPVLVPRRPVIRPVRRRRDRLHGGVGRTRRIRGARTRPERWVAQTNFENDEAVGYLGDRLARLGVEDELVRLGARPGCAVTIGDMTFDWEPQTPCRRRHRMSGRGTDVRLEHTDRIGADERKAARRQRRTADDDAERSDAEERRR